MVKKGTAGIYAIINMIDGKKYIGQAKDIKIRNDIELSSLKGNYFHNQHLQNAFNKYGEENFIFIFLEECSEEKLNEREIYHIKAAGWPNHDLCYNIKHGGEGGNMLPETIEKIRIATSGENNYINKMSPEKLEIHLEKRSKAHKGIKQSEETIIKRAEANTGENNWINKLTSEECEEYLRKKSEAMIENHPLKKMSPKEYEMYLRKQSERMTGENNWIAKLSPEEYDEECKRRSERMTGENNWINKLTPEEREEYSKKVSESHSGDNHYLNKMEPEEREEFLRNKAQAVIDNGTFKGENNPMSGKVHPNKGKKYPEFSGDNHWLNKVSDEEREEVCKGRSERVTGENNPTAQVTERKVSSIKLLLRNLTHKGAIQEIAAIYGVKPRVISRIKNGETWSHVKVHGWDY